MSRSGIRRALAMVAVAAALVSSPGRSARAQAPSGSTLSPDFRSYMVNKDLGDERWTIDLNLYAADPSSIISITGNIFRKDGGPASFVTCLVRDDSNGSLRSPSSTFRLSCSGANACASTARQCAREDWTLIDDDVRVPASFFLPPGGNGASAVQDAGVSDALVEYLRTLVARARDATLRGVGRVTQPAVAFAQAGGRGATLTLDSLSYLVTKDVGSERWSISFTLAPFVTDQGGVESRFLSVTGNVYQSDGSPPSFVFCTQRGDSSGSLSDPTSSFRFSCDGADACATTATSCAQSGWRKISDDVALPASFFLPPLGQPAAPQSDGDIVVIGRTSDPPSIFAPGDASPASVAFDAPAGACPSGTGCTIARVGGCSNVSGVVVNDATYGCRCLLANVPDSCITCGGGAAGQCGGPCAYPVAGSTARGQCLPSSSESTGCICWAIGAGQSEPAQGCGGVLGVECPGDRCCANDPRNSCDPVGGQIACPGICVDANGCDPSVEQCGICLTQPGLPTPTPDDTPTPTPAVTPRPTATPVPTPAATPTPCLPRGASCLGDPAPCCNGLVCERNPLAERFVCDPIVP